MASNCQDHEGQGAMAASRNTSGTSTPLRDVDAFERYCTEVQEKLALHAFHRISFLQSAYDRLNALYQAAKDIEDSDLCQELSDHLSAARELLEAARKFTAAGQAAPAPLTHRPVAPHAPRQTSLPIVPPVSQLSRRAEHATPVAPPSPNDAQQPPISRGARRPMRPLIDIEADAVALRSELKEWAKQHPLTNASGELDIPNCLRIRAIACRHRRLEEECGDTEVAEVTELSEDIIDLLDAANDQEYTVALDDELDPRPTAYQWGELAERYSEMARAQEGFEWWQKHRNLLAVSDVQPLAEAVAAVQQRFNRLLFRIGARDPFQQQLFDDLRTWAREDQCYLYSLRPKVPMAELMEKAATLEDAWQHARQPVADEQQRQELVDNVVALVSEPDFGEHGDHDEQVLRETLWECKNHRVSPADKKLKDALAPWCSFLEGDDRFKDILREATAEWEHQAAEGKLEGTNGEAGEPPSADLASIRAITAGKRCLVLGGAPSAEGAAKIQGVLELSHLDWPNLNPNEDLQACREQLDAADLVILISRYSRRDWREVQQICYDAGKLYVHAASNSDLPVFVRHLLKHIGGAGGRK